MKSFGTVYASGALKKYKHAQVQKCFVSIMMDTGLRRYDVQ